MLGPEFQGHDYYFLDLQKEARTHAFYNNVQWSPYILDQKIKPTATIFVLQQL